MAGAMTAMSSVEEWSCAFRNRKRRVKPVSADAPVACASPMSSTRSTTGALAACSCAPAWSRTPPEGDCLSGSGPATSQALSTSPLMPVPYRSNERKSCLIAASAFAASPCKGVVGSLDLRYPEASAPRGCDHAWSWPMAPPAARLEVGLGRRAVGEAGPVVVELGAKAVAAVDARDPVE